MNKSTLNIKNLLLPEDPFNLGIPYADRQRIVVVTDEELESERRSRNRRIQQEGHEAFMVGTDGVVMSSAEDNSVIRESSTVIGRQLRDNICDIKDFGVNFKRALDDRVVRGALRRQLGALMVGRTEARAVHFDQGHPLRNYLYIGHPAKRDVYFPAAEFHRRVFEHKFVEAVRLLSSLGAHRIVVQQETKRTERREWAAVAARQGFTRKRSAIRRSTAMFEAEFPGSRTPIIPGNLCWYPDEPTWQMIATARIDSGARKTSLAVTYTTDYGIDAQVMKAAGACGINIGGRFEEQHDTVWRLDAEFPGLVR